MPRNSNRQAPQGNYDNAPKNLRNFAKGIRIIRQGIITDPQQNVNNTEHIIKYLILIEEQKPLSILVINPGKID